MTLTQQYLLENYSQEDRSRAQGAMRDFSDKECLVLLGPAGAGKSETVKQYRAAEESEEILVHYFDLGTYNDNSELRDEVKDILRDTGDAHRVVLVLDSLDECPAHAPLNAVVRLLRKLGSEKLDKVQLRMVCRSAYWAARSDLEEVLSEIWNEVFTADIEPLRREDVDVALQGEGIDTERFWNAVGRAGAHALTKQPLTLRLLLREYLEQDRQLPSTRAALYNSGCRRLAEEHDPRRRRRSKLGRDQVLETLRPLAAAMILSQRPTLWVGDSHDRPDEDLMIDDILQKEYTLPSGRALRRGDLLEVKNTGFLKGTRQSEEKPERLAWVERTFAEFLSAQFLKENDLTLGQLLDLLAAPNDPERRIAPPMHEVASWLAAWRADLFEHILGTDPVVLLTGDVASYSEAERYKLTRRLLDIYDAGDLVSFGHAAEPGSRQLAAEGVDELLVSYIASDERTERARELAIKLASWNQRTALLPALKQLAFDSGTPAPLRAEAVEAIGKIARASENEEALQKVVPLLDLEGNEDASFSIRGAVLDAAYPTALSFTDIKPHLRASKEDADARYQLFIERDLIPAITPAELHSAFEWLSGQEATVQEAYPSGAHVAFEDLEHALYLRAAEVLIGDETEGGTVADAVTVEAITAALAEHMVARAGRHMSLPNSFPWHLDQKNRSFDELWTQHASLRHQVVPVLLQTAEEDFDEVAIWLAGFNNILQESPDFYWILRKASSETDPVLKGRWLQLAQRFFSMHDIDVLRLHLSEDGVRKFFTAQAKLGEDATPEDILSAFEEQRKENLAWQEKWRQERAERDEERQRQQLTTDDLREALERLQSAEDLVEPHVPWVVTLRECRDLSVRGDLTDMQKNPVWKEADADLRGRMLEAARDFLKAVEFSPDEWVQAPHVWQGLPMMSIAALRLLHDVEVEPFEHWSKAEWSRWAAIVAACEPVTAKDTEAMSALLKLFYENAPEAVISSALARVDVEGASENRAYLRSLRKFGPVWDERLAAALSGKADDLALDIHTYGEVMNRLLATDLEEPWRLAAEHVTGAHFEKERSPEDEPHDSEEIEDSRERLMRLRALEASTHMLKHDPERTWPALWPVLEASDEFADRLVRRNSRMLWGRDGTVLAPLNADQLEKLYRQLSRLYPHDEDPERPSGVTYSPTFRDDAGRFRGSVLQKLVSIGASQHIARLRADLPHLEWLAETQRRADEVAMRTDWKPHEPSEVLRITQDKSARLARSSTELLEVVTEALRNMEQDLRGHPPAVYDLWNSAPLSRILKVGSAEMDRASEEGAGAAAKAIEDLARKGKSRNPCYVFKEEADVSDYVARYLSRKLRRTVIGREVEVEPGNKPDLRVSAFTRGSSLNDEETAYVAVEVKGSWNGSVYTAMEKQLADRYLATPDCRHGIFLVAWPYCERWHGSDWRKKDSRRGGIDKLRRKLGKQASALSRERRTVRAVVADVSLPNG